MNSLGISAHYHATIMHSFSYVKDVALLYIFLYSYNAIRIHVEPIFYTKKMYDI